MKIYKVENRAFTIVELAVVISVIGILAAVTIVGYGSWRQNLAKKEVRSDLMQAASSLKSSKNFDNGYPSTISDDKFTSSPNVTVSYSSDGMTYCAQGVSTQFSNVTYYITDASSEPIEGTCGEGGGAGGGGPALPVIAGMRLGLDARDLSQAENSTVTAWSDTSDGQRDASILTGSPKFHSENGIDYVHVDSSNILDTPSLGITGAQPRHIVARVRTQDLGTMFGWGAQAQGRIFDLWNFSGPVLIWHGYGGGYDTVSGAPAMSLNSWHVVEGWYTGSQVGIRVDGGAPTTLDININTADSNFRIGAGNYGNTWSGDISGIYIFDDVLTDTEAESMRTYLSN